MNAQQAGEMLAEWKRMKEYLAYLESELSKYVLETRTGVFTEKAIAQYMNDEDTDLPYALFCLDKD